MQPLTRQRTPESVLSWWSDSNPGLNGPTINLHTLAKPLMRRMYDRDALKYIQKQHGIPLSAENVEIYLSYLLWKYVSPSTKEEIMKDLAERVRSEDDALAVVHSNILNNIRLLLPSPLEWSPVNRIIFALTEHPSTASVACLSLVDLLSDSDGNVVEWACVGLTVIAKSSEERAEAVLRAKVLDHFLRGLSSPVVRRYLKHIIFALTGHSSTALAACSSLIHLSSNDDAEVVESAWKALADVAGSSDDGAKVAVEAKVLDHVSKGLLSPIASVRYSACRTVSYVAGFMSTLPAAIASPEVLVPLFTLLNDADVDQTAWRAVSEIATSPSGAEAVVKAEVLHLVPRALLSRDIEVRSAACEVVERLAGHESTFPVVIRALPEFLGVFALFNDVNVIQRAWHIVSRIATSPLGAEALVTANVLDLVPGALSSPDARSTACQLVERLARHESTMPAVIRALPEFLSVCTLFNDVDVQSAWRIVSRIAISPLGAEALVKANVLDLVPAALLSPDTRSTACQLLERLAGHESTMRAVMRALPEFLVTLVKLLDPSAPSNHAIYQASIALHSIARSAEGAEAAVAENILDPITQWFSAGGPLYPDEACDILQQLAKHDSTLSAVVRMVPRDHIVSLSRAKYKEAQRTLTKIDAYLESHSEPSPGLHETHLPVCPETGASLYSIPEDSEPGD